MKLTLEEFKEKVNDYDIDEDIKVTLLEDLTDSFSDLESGDNIKYKEKYIVLGLKIAYYRLLAGYTQEAFAEKIGKSLNFLAQVEGTGTVRGVSLETLFKIADVLQLSPAKLF